jgi:RNA polymerase sigma-70 factor, ECF subfamily
LEDGELELARGFAHREPWAYEAAYRAHGRVLYAAALGVLRDDADAQDCVHDVLMRLWRRGDAYRPERGSLRAFLAVCVRTEALSRSRKARNRERLEAAAAPPEPAPDIAPPVVERAAIKSALVSLGEKQRESIELAYYRGMTHEQIAQQLGEPVGTVKSRLSSALRALRAAFAREEPLDAR